MSNSYFQFKQFTVRQDKCAMKVGTDGVLLGAWVDVDRCNRILDVGTGTGLIALMLAQRSEALIEAIDIDAAACEQAQENAAASPFAGRVQVAHTAFANFDNTYPYDLIVSNPPYSISQWNRKAFESDPYGRNFLGVPPQGRADYAFFQHILKSMKPVTGRCAILFPHGVLFRNEEKEMREKLVRSDLLDCVIGLGPNLFYNSPMEACIVICRTKKPDSQKGYVLFINAVNEVTRKNAESFLEPSHIETIRNAYEAWQTDGVLAKKVSIREIEKNDFSMNLTLYVSPAKEKKADTKMDIQSCYQEWAASSARAHQEYDALSKMLESGERNG